MIRCNECKYWYVITKDRSGGQCRRHAPTVHVVMAQTQRSQLAGPQANNAQPVFLGGWADTGAKAGCGEGEVGPQLSRFDGDAN